MNILSSSSAAQAHQSPETIDRMRSLAFAVTILGLVVSTFLVANFCFGSPIMTESNVVMVP